MGNRPKKRHRRIKTSRRARDYPVDDSTSVNIFDVSFCGRWKSLLSKGLSLCPKPSYIDKFQMGHDLKQFEGKLRLQELFYNLDETISNTRRNPFKCKSMWTPAKSREPNLETYITLVTGEISCQLDHAPKQCSGDNLTPGERKALLSLRKGTDIVIKPADKCSATMIMSRTDYEAHSYQNFSWECHYRDMKLKPWTTSTMEISTGNSRKLRRNNSRRRSQHPWQTFLIDR